MSKADEIRRLREAKAARGTQGRATAPRREVPREPVAPAGKRRPVVEPFEVPPLPDGSFDRATYQREYLRRYRAAKRAMTP